MRIEDQILSQLCVNESFARASLPHLKREYFSDVVDAHIFGIINEFILKYNRLPSQESLLVDLNNSTGLSDTQFEAATKRVQSFTKEVETRSEWLLERTEQFCQDRAIHNAIRDSILIMENKAGKLTKENIPSLLSNALSVSFDTSVGHDFLDSFDQRYEYYHKKENRLSTGLSSLDEATGGGLSRKTLNLFMGGTGTGKSLCKCAIAANMLKDGYNVLYITMEMAEEKIAERIDANLMGITIDELHSLSKSEFDKKIQRVKDTVKGKLIIKEYPTGGASSANFRHLIRELKQKKNFTVDVVFLDYLNICSSARVKVSDGNSYSFVKHIAEEIRGLAVETNTVWISSTQTNRSGYDNTDVDMTNVSESFGIAATVDLLIAIIRTEELDSLNQLMFKQLKNRYRDLSMMRKFMVGVLRSKMKLYDVENSTQGLISEDDDRPVMDKTVFGQRLADESRKKFKEFK